MLSAQRYEHLAPSEHGGARVADRTGTPHFVRATRRGGETLPIAWTSLATPVSDAMPQRGIKTKMCVDYRAPCATRFVRHFKRGWGWRTRYGVVYGNRRRCFYRIAAPTWPLRCLLLAYVALVEKHVEEAGPFPLLSSLRAKSVIISGAVGSG